MVSVSLVLLLAVAAASRLRVRHDAADFLPRNSPGQLHIQPALRGERLLVLVRSDRALGAAAVAPLLDTLAAHLAQVPGVMTVSHRLDPALLDLKSDAASRHALLFLTADELSLLADRLGRPHMEQALLHPAPVSTAVASVATLIDSRELDPLGIAGIAQRAHARAFGIGRLVLDDGYFASADRRAYALMIEPAHRLDDLGAARALVSALDSTLASVRGDAVSTNVPGDLQFLLLGRAVAYVRGSDALLDDVRRVTVAAAIVVALLLALCLRRALAPLLVLATSAVGLLLTAALAWVIFGAVSLVAWAFIAALVGFGDEFALYIMTHFWLTPRRGDDRTAALASALQRPGPGIVLGAGTSAAAFLSLGTVSYPVMWQLGLLTALGILCILLASFTVLPLLLSFLPQGRPLPHLVHQASISGGTTRTARWRGATILSFALLVGVSLLAARSVRFEPHPWKVVVHGLPVTAQLDSVRRQFGMALSPIQVESQGATPEEALDRDREVVAALDSLRYRAGIASIVSLSRWLPSREQQRNAQRFVAEHAALFSSDRFERDVRSVAAEMPPGDTVALERVIAEAHRFLRQPEALTLDTLQALGLGPIVATHLRQVEGGYVASTDVFLTRLPWEKGTTDRFRRVLESSGNPSLRAATFVGDALRGANHAGTLRREMLRAALVAVGLTVLILMLRFRRPGLVALSLLPLGVALVATLGFMGLAGLEANVLSLAVAPILIGIGSDDGIHIVDRLARGEHLDTVLEQTGVPMVITTLTTIAAFACLGLARFPGVREVGLVASVGLVVALAASLLLLPAVLGRSPGSHHPHQEGDRGNDQEHDEEGLRDARRG